MAHPREVFVRLWEDAILCFWSRQQTHLLGWRDLFALISEEALMFTERLSVENASYYRIFLWEGDFYRSACLGNKTCSSLLTFVVRVALLLITHLS